MEEDLESVALPDSDVNKLGESATNENLQLVWLLAGLESKQKFISNLNLNNLDLVQALINFGGEKVVYTHPNYSVVTIIGGKLWSQLWNNFNYKYAKIEPVSYYFEVKKNEDESEENGFFYALEDESAESKMEDDLESVALPDGDLNKPQQSATSDKLDLVWLLAGLQWKPEIISNLNLNNGNLLQTLIN